MFATAPLFPPHPVVAGTADSLVRVPCGVLQLRVARAEALAIHQEQSEAATRVQRIARGRQGRRRFEAVREEEAIRHVQTQGAVAMQSAYRGHAARSRVAELRAEQLQSAEAAAATSIQAAARGRRTRRRMRVQRMGQLAEDRDNAATKLQSVARGRRDRARIVELRAEREAQKADDAAVRIQSVARGRRDRDRVRVLQEEQQQRHQAAVRIQSKSRQRAASARVDALRADKIAGVLYRGGHAWQLGGDNGASGVIHGLVGVSMYLDGHAAATVLSVPGELQGSASISKAQVQHGVCAELWVASKSHALCFTGLGAEPWCPLHCHAWPLGGCQPACAPHTQQCIGLVRSIVVCVCACARRLWRGHERLMIAVIVATHQVMGKGLAGARG